jgi:hypothetical protein
MVELPDFTANINTEGVAKKNPFGQILIAYKKLLQKVAINGFCMFHTLLLRRYFKNVLHVPRPQTQKSF